jgi:hypothetical protein
MRVSIAVTLILGWVAISIYTLWRVAQDLVIIRYASEPPLADPDDYDLAPNANQLLAVVQTARQTIDELHGDREQT